MLDDGFFREIDFIFVLFGKWISDTSKVYIVATSGPNLNNIKAMYREPKALFIKISLDVYSPFTKKVDAFPLLNLFLVVISTSTLSMGHFVYFTIYMNVNSVWEKSSNSTSTKITYLSVEYHKFISHFTPF